MNQLSQYSEGKGRKDRAAFKAALKHYLHIRTAVDLGLISMNDPECKAAFEAMKKSFNKEFVDEL